MDNILKKVRNGKSLLPQEWKQLLLNYHQFHTGDKIPINWIESVEDFETSQFIRTWDK